MFDLGFVVYAIVIVASILLVLCTVWKYLLMKGEKSLLNGETVKGGAVA
jgi:glycopeptide antibiotics resistance protein